MTSDDVLKLKAASLYVLDKCGELDLIHLFKILYFAERSHFAAYGKHLIKDRFCALPRGPVPSFLYDAIKISLGTKEIHKEGDLYHLSLAFRGGDAECSYMVSAAEKPDLDELSKADIADLDESIQKHLSKTPTQLSNESHDLAWTRAWNTRNSSRMDPYAIAEAGGASSEFIEFIKEQDALNDYLKQ